MPNWCDTTYKAVGTKEQVKKFYELALSSWNKSNDDNSGWLGHFVTELGCKWEDVPCRGWMQDEPYLCDDFEDDYAECIIYCNTAWGELYEWRHFIEKEIDGLFIEYLAIETGCLIYESNMDEYIGEYYVDYLNDGTEILSEEKTIKYVNEHFDKKFTTIDECINFAGEHTNEEGEPELWINQIEEGE